MQRPMVRLLIALSFALLALGAGLLGARPAHAITERCFPETGQCIDGRFRQFWEAQGGIPVLGYPITAARNERNRDTGQTYLTQWFERNRFEYHPENAPPYDVLLGRLGDDRLLQQGRVWLNEPREDGPRVGCLWFPRTGHNVCDQASGRGFRQYWLGHGLRDPGLNTYDASLALFGYPLTAPRMETNSSGDRVLTQWFERARFEWHAGNPDAHKVLLGRLGVEVRAQEDSTPPVFTRAKIYLIALDDNGRSGPKIGCNDSVIPVTVDLAPTTTPLTAALQRLLALDDRFYGESGLYHALHQADLQVDSVNVRNGTATIRLTGQLRVGGVCDDPRIEAQITQTALQYSSVNTVAVFVNDRPLREALSQR